MKRTLTLVSSFFLLLAACASPVTATQPARPQTLTIMTHDSFALSEAVVTAFEQANARKC